MICGTGGEEHSIMLTFIAFDGCMLLAIELCHNQAGRRYFQ